MELIARDICKRFGEKEVLRGASFTFEKEGIYGPARTETGAGQTTLFNCMNEDVKADGGSFEIAGDDGRRRPIGPEDIGYVLSTPVVPEFLTGREFLKFFVEINQAKLRDPKPLDEYFELMKMPPRTGTKLLKDYSIGMKNKMQMLVNFIANPTILLLDEPLTSFDVVVADEMKQLLRHIKNDHIIIFSTHIMELALDLCDDIVILNDGILEEIEKENLDNTAFKDKIIAALRGDDDA